MQKHYCYLLKSLEYDNLSYIGYSIDPFRRLKQHNGELVGGAKATKKSKWGISVILEFFSKSDALKYEYQLKKYRGFINRFNSIQKPSVIPLNIKKIDE